jgi:hypothetical protein
MTDYVFGYGSLLERASRTRTNPDAVGAWPARVTGYSRGWYHQFSKYVGSTCTFLGAAEDEGKTINGVIYKVADLESTKKREVGYTPIALRSQQIEMLDGGGPFEVGEGANIYIFVSNPDSISDTKAPTAECPIVQSYVDICIGGCLEIDAIYRATRGTFTQEFISSTTGWNENWVNDRAYPRRSSFTLPNANEIDRALNKGKKLHYVQLHDLK